MSIALHAESSKQVPKHKRRRAWAKFPLQILLGVTLMGGLMLWLGLDALPILLHIRSWPLVGALACTVVVVACIGLRWRTLVRTISGCDLPLRESCRYFLWNRTLGFLIPKDLSDLGGRTALLTTRHGIPVPRAVASVLLDRLFDLTLPLLLLGPALLFLTDTVDGKRFILGLLGLPLIACATLSVAGKAIITRTASLYSKATAWAWQRFPQTRRWPMPPQFPVLSGATLSCAFGLSALKFYATALRFACYARALDLDISPAIFVAGTPITQLSFLLALTPGGLGVLEATWYGILTYTHVSERAIAPFLLAQRVLTMGCVGGLTVFVELWRSLTADRM